MTVPDVPRDSYPVPVRSGNSAPIASRSKNRKTAVLDCIQRYPKLTICLGVGLLSYIGLMISNPNQDRYTAYAAGQVDGWLKDKCSEVKGNLRIFVFGIPLKDICQGAVQLGDKGVEFGIQKMTQPRKNYGLFSVYITEIPSQGTFTTLGIGGQFITFQNDQ